MDLCIGLVHRGYTSRKQAEKYFARCNMLVMFWGPQFWLLKKALCHSVIFCSLVELPSLATLQMDMTKVRET